MLKKYKHQNLQDNSLISQIKFFNEDLTPERQITEIRNKNKT